MLFRKGFFKHASDIAIYLYSGQILVFLASTVTSRLLTPKEFGMIALINVFSGFLNIFIDTGISAAVIRHKIDKTYYTALQGLSILIGFLLALMMFIISFPISKFYNRDMLLPSLVYGLIIFSSAFPIVSRAIVSKELRFKIVGKTDFISTLFTICFTILLAYFNCSYWSIILPQLIVPWISYFLYRQKTNLPLRFPRIIETKNVFNEVKLLIGNVSGFTFFNYWARNADNLIVGKFFGESSLGLYNRAYTLLLMPLNMITGVFNVVQLPNFEKLKSENKNINREYINLLKTISIIVFPISCLFLIIPHELCLFLWGSAWEKVGDFLPYIGVLLLMQTMTSTTGSMFIVYRKEKTLFIMGTVNALILISAIIVGAQFSVLSILIFYSFSFIFICIPITLVWGYRKSYLFSWKEILDVWGLDLIFCMIILIFLILKDVNFIIVLTLLLLLLKGLRGYLLLKKMKK